MNLSEWILPLVLGASFALVFWFLGEGFSL